MAHHTTWRQLPDETSPIFDETSDTVIRQSTIGQFQLCEMRVGYRDHEDFLEPVSEKLAFGTFVHYLIENDLQEDKEQVELLANMGDWMNEILKVEYDWSLDKVDNHVELFSQVGTAYRLWRTEVRPNIRSEILSVEDEVYMYLGPGEQGNIFLKGTPDIDCKSYLRDVKTSGNRWSQEKADYSIQASLYLALSKYNTGVAKKDFYFDTFWRGKSYQEWTTIKTSRTEREINAALATAYAAGLKLESGKLTANPVPENFNKKRGWYCSVNYCPAWNCCEYKYMHDDTDETVVAIRSWN